MSPSKKKTPPRTAKPFGGVWCAMACTLLAVGILITFWWVVGDCRQAKFLGAADAWQYYGPTQYFLDYCIHQGELPLWNPLFFCGQPHAANPQSFVFYPPNLIRSLLTFHPTPFKTHVGIALLVFLQLLLGGMGTLFLARRHGLSFGASLVAMFGFTFSAPMVTRSVGHWIFLNTICWLPLLLLLLNLALADKTFRGAIRLAAIAGVVWGMAILGGVPNLILAVGLTVAGYWFLMCILYVRSDIRSWRALRQVAARDLIVLTLLFGIGLMIASPLLLPAREFAGFTQRANTQNADQEDFAPMSIGWDLVKALVLYQGHGHHEGLRASGAAIVFLALAALFCRRRRDAILFGMLFLILLDCSLSQPLLFGRVLRGLAPFKLSNPARAMIAACLPLALLAGVGVDAITMPLSSLRWKLARSALLTVLGGLLVSILVFATRPLPLLPVGPTAIVLPALVCVAAILAGWIPAPTLWGAAIALLAFGEILAWNRELIPASVPESSYYTGSLEALHSPRTFWADNRRGADVTPNLMMYDLRAIANGYDPLHLRDVGDVLCNREERHALKRNILATELSLHNDRGQLLFKRPFWLVRQFVSGPLPGKGVLFPATTTAFLDTTEQLPIPCVARESLPRTGVSDKTRRAVLRRPEEPPFILSSEESAKGNGFKITAFHVPPMHSSLFVVITSTAEVDVTPVFTEPASKLTEFSRVLKVKPTGERGVSYEIPMPDFANTELTFVGDFKGHSGELAIRGMSIESDLNDEDALIHIVSRSANSVAVDVGPLPAPRLLLCVDADYPGWQAWVDDQPVPILRANNAFKAVVLPEGSHRVQFVFHSWRVWLGIGLALAAFVSMLVCVGLPNKAVTQPQSDTHR